MRHLLTGAALLGLLVTVSACSTTSTDTAMVVTTPPANVSPVAHNWQGSIQLFPSQTANLNLRPDGYASLQIIRQPKPSYVLSGRWVYQGDRLSLRFTQLSPSSTADAVWPLNEPEVGTVTFDKGGKKMILKFNDPAITISVVRFD